MFNYSVPLKFNQLTWAFYLYLSFYPNYLFYLGVQLKRPVEVQSALLRSLSICLSISVFLSPLSIYLGVQLKRPVEVQSALLRFQSMCLSISVFLSPLSILYIYLGVQLKRPVEVQSAHLSFLSMSVFLSYLPFLSRCSIKVYCYSSICSPALSI